jgi:hypothetical protein
MLSRSSRQKEQPEDEEDLRWSFQIFKFWILSDDGQAANISHFLTTTSDLGESLDTWRERLLRTRLK